MACRARAPSQSASDHDALNVQYSHEPSHNLRFVLSALESV